MSGRLGGVPGGESWFRLLAIIREAAAGRREESPVAWALGDGRPRDWMGKRQPESLGAALSPYEYAWERTHPSLPWGPLLSPEIRLVLTKPHPLVTQPCTDLVPPLLAPLRPSCSLGLPHPARTCAVPSAWHAVPRGPTGSGVLSNGTSSETAS